MASKDSFKVKSELKVDGKSYTYYSLKKMREHGASKISKLPFSLKILLENLLRREDGVVVTKDDIDGLINWDPKAEPDRELAFMPARVVLQDFTGVPCIADLAAMRDALKKLGGNPSRINPLQTAELVIDHTVKVDYFGTRDAMA